MVPPALSSLLSYEAEQRNVAKLQKYNDADYRYFKQDDDDEKLSEEADTNVLPHGSSYAVCIATLDSSRPAIMTSAV